MESWAPLASPWRAIIRCPASLDDTAARLTSDVGLTERA